MRVEITASGSAAHVKTEVANQLDAIGREGSPEAWPALASLRDYVAHLANKAPADSELVVAFKVDISVTQFVASKKGK